MIYLDCNASTPLDERVLDAMLPLLRAAGNPSAIHRAGRSMRDSADHAREQIGLLTGLDPTGVVFCSGATEANNLALVGAALAAQQQRRRLVCSSVEHPSVLMPIRALRRQGFEVLEVAVDLDGRVELGALAEAVDDSTLLVSVQAANGEVGTVHPLEAVAEVVHHRGALLHVDAAQAAIGLNLPLNVADLLTLSAHKMYGPQGSGALVAAVGVRSLLRPLLHGGGQEGGLRSGTLNVAGAVGLGMAAELAVTQREQDAEHLSSLRDRLMALFVAQGAELNGPLAGRLPGNLNMRFPGADADAVLATCPEVAFSAGSACASTSSAPSHVLQSLGLSAEQADESLRFGIGRATTLEDVDRAGAAVARAAARARQRQGACA